MIKVLTETVGVMNCNCYIIYDTNSKDAFIIDAGDDAELLINKINSIGLTPKAIISSHGHFDHNMAVFEIQTCFNIPFFISEKDVFLLNSINNSAKYYINIDDVIIPKPSKYLTAGQKFDLGNSYFYIIDLPGHTPGGIGFYNPAEEMMFSGDVIFKHGATGRYDFSYSSKNKLLKSIDKILKLPENTVIYTGHGEPTHVKSEIAYY